MNKHEAHNKGQEDAANGKFERPYTAAEVIVKNILSGNSGTKAREANDAYYDGHKNHKK